MKHSALTLLVILFINSIAIAQDTSDSKTVMRMVCLKTSSGLFGPSTYTRKVFVIQQNSPDLYDGSIFTAATMKINKVNSDGANVVKTIKRTQEIPFTVRVFPQVNNLDNLSSLDSAEKKTEFVNTLGENLMSNISSNPHSQVSALGYRMNMEIDKHIHFDVIGKKNDYFQYDIDKPENTGYNLGDDGGSLECYSPHTVEYDSLPTVLVEESNPIESEEFDIATAK